MKKVLVPRKRSPVAGDADFSAIFTNFVVRNKN